MLTVETRSYFINLLADSYTNHDGELVDNGETGLTTQLINPSYDTQYSKMVD